MSTLLLTFTTTFVAINNGFDSASKDCLLPWGKQCAPGYKCVGYQCLPIRSTRKTLTANNQYIFGDIKDCESNKQQLESQIADMGSDITLYCCWTDQSQNKIELKFDQSCDPNLKISKFVSRARKNVLQNMYNAIMQTSDVETGPAETQSTTCPGHRQCFSYEKCCCKQSNPSICACYDKKKDGDTTNDICQNSN